MKTKFFLPIFLLGLSVQAQDGIDQLLAAGVEDAEQFAQDYFSPAAKGVIYGISKGWYNTADGKNLGHFEISVIGNASFVDDKYKSFTLNVADYNYIEFQDPSQQTARVATALGENNPEVTVVIDAGGSKPVEITLPQGIGAAGIDILPTAFLQLSVGIFKGTEIKVRYLPKIKKDDVQVQLYGGAIQHELTSWLPGAKMLPISIGVLVGYTELKAQYDLSNNSSIMEGENQKIKNQTSSLVFSAIVSTKLPVINFYGGLGYVKGDSKTDMLGTYRVQAGVLENEELVDPLSVETEISGFKATLGTRLKLGFFSLHADYSFQEFNNVNVTAGIGLAF